MYEFACNSVNLDSNELHGSYSTLIAAESSSRETAETENWDVANMPFINPDEYLDTANSTVPIQNSNDVAIEWLFDSNSVIALVYVHSRLVSTLKEGSRPGWSTSVVKDGPLANMYLPNFL